MAAVLLLERPGTRVIPDFNARGRLDCGDLWLDDPEIGPIHDGHSATLPEITRRLCDNMPASESRRAANEEVRRLCSDHK